MTPRHLGELLRRVRCWPSANARSTSGTVKLSHTAAHLARSQLSRKGALLEGREERIQLRGIGPCSDGDCFNTRGPT